jgi:hypothetical protein
MTARRAYEHPNALAALRAGGFIPRVEGEHGAEILKIRGPRDPVTGELRLLPAELAAEIRRDNQAIVEQLIAERWTDRLDELFEQLRRHYPADEAERLAYQGLLWERHLAYIKQRPHAEARRSCGLCGKPLADDRVPLGDGAFVHQRCSAVYDQRWRIRAAAALAELGIIIDVPRSAVGASE